MGKMRERWERRNMVWGGKIREKSSKWGIGERRDAMRDMVRLMDV